MMDAENCHRVFDWLWTSGQLSARDIAELPSLGVEAVLNLAPPSAHNALSGEAEAVTGLGLGYFQIPVDWEAPHERQYRQFVALLQGYRDSRIWVHCARNMRVSAFVFLSRCLELGEDAAVASHPMREVWQPNPVWRDFIDGVLARDRQAPAQ